MSAVIVFALGRSSAGRRRGARGDSTGDELHMTAVRERLPKKRRLSLRTATIGGHTLHTGVGRFPDGSLAEIWIDLAHREGAPLREFAKGLAKTISVALQHRVSPLVIAAQYRGIAFEPSGDVTGDEDITEATSLLDYLAQVLEVEHGRVR